MGEAYLVQGGLQYLIQALSPKSEDIQLSGNYGWNYGATCSVGAPTPSFPWSNMYIKVDSYGDYPVTLNNGSCSRGGSVSLRVYNRDGYSTLKYTLSSDGTKVTKSFTSGGGDGNDDYGVLVLTFTGKS